ncbi:MAG: phosphoribosylglycinamide formyltransferase, partial [Lachnospiraceae bacterium]|nr:phosphoribosylglycinamide formyltransferase [Lachnospiraceae bacterium]
MLRVCVCVSGGGTNLQAIIDAMDEGRITNAQLVRVISNNKGAYALERAGKKGIDAVAVSPKDYESRELFNEAFLRCVDDARPDLIVLAGFLVVLPPAMIQRYEG